MKFLLSLLSILAFQFGINAQPLIQTYAGGGVGGNGVPATQSTIQCEEFDIDRYGNLYFVNENGNSITIRKIDTTGIITHYAGNPNSPGGYYGDNGPALLAGIESVEGIAVDTAGNVYVVDRYNIRKIDAVTGIITRFAGNGTSGFSGDGGPASLATFSVMNDMAVDRNNNLLVCDGGNRVRKINLTTGIVSTIAGTGVNAHNGDGGLAVNAGVLNPSDIKVDTLGNIYINEALGQYIRKIDVNTGIISTIASNFFLAYSLCVDNYSNVYTGDLGCYCIKRIDAANNNVAQIAGNGIYGYNGDGIPLLAAAMKPHCMELFKGKVYISDQDRIRIFTLPSPLNGQITSQSNNDCINDSAASITIYASDGWPPYLYSLDGINYQPNSTFTGLTTDNYTIYIKDTVGSVYHLNATIIATNTTLPAANFTYNQIDNHQYSFTSNSTGADSVLWLLPDNITDTATIAYHTFYTEGVYDITLIAYNGCGADTMTITLPIIFSSVSENNSLSTFNLYPNPTNGSVTLKLQADKRIIGKLRIVNSIGQVVYAEAVNFNSTYSKTIDVSSFASGLYMVALQTETGNTYRKLVVE